MMNYNLLNYPGSTPERHQYMRQVVHYSEPDIVLSNELISRSGSRTLLDSAFNRFGTAKYDTARFIDGPDTDNMLFYNTDKIGLADQDTIQTQLRKIDHYKVYYKETGLGSTHTDTNFLHLFALHLKASTGWSDQQQRGEEATKLMEYLETLGDSAEIIVAGDFNIYWPTSEPAWAELTNDTYGNMLIDPLQTTDDWHDDPQYSDIHTQSTRDNGCTGTAVGATGGMDDRFDLNLVDDDVMNGNGHYRLLESTYHALAQQGDHLDTCIIAPPNISIVPDSVRQAVYNMSDHLPVIMDVEWDSTEGTAGTGQKLDREGSPMEFRHIREQDRIELRSSRPLMGDVRVFDLQGRGLLEKEGKGRRTLELSTSELPSGIYLLEFRSEDGRTREVWKWSKAR